MVVAPSLNNDVTQSMMDSARVGLDYIVENADYIEKLASGNSHSKFYSLTLITLNTNITLLIPNTWVVSLRDA